MSITYILNKTKTHFLLAIIGVAALVLIGCKPAYAGGLTTSYQTIKPISISICTGKTTNLIFPFAIKSADRGSSGFIARIAKGADNILQIKAVSAGFLQTNLTVITADGSLYSFLVDYVPNPPVINYVLPNTKSLVVESPVGQNLPAVQKRALLVKSKKKFLHLRKKNNGISLALDGLYIKDGLMYFQLEVDNHSPIDYHLDALRFFIKDAKKLKRTAYQELVQQPIIQMPTNQVVYHQTKKKIVIALPAFTLDDKKTLSIGLTEQNGGRHIELKIKNRRLLRTKVL